MKTFNQISIEEFRKLAKMQLVWKDENVLDHIVWTYGPQEDCRGEDGPDDWFGIEQYKTARGDTEYVVRICQHYVVTNDFNHAENTWFEYLKGEEFVATYEETV